jgi:hypothetical protein
MSSSGTHRPTTSSSRSIARTRRSGAGPLLYAGVAAVAFIATMAVGLVVKGAATTGADGPPVLAAASSSLSDQPGAGDRAQTSASSTATGRPTGTAVVAAAATMRRASRVSDITGVGDSTSQWALDFLADGDVSGDQGYNVGKMSRIKNFDADDGRTEYALGSPADQPVPMHPTVVLAAGTKPVQLPQSSQAGIAALLADTSTTKSNIQFVRSSVLPSAAQQARARSLGWGGLHVYRYATDRLEIAVAGAATNAPNGLSAAEILGIYDGTYRTWGQLPGYSGPAAGDPIIALLPRTGTDARALFDAALKAANGGTAVTYGSNTVLTGGDDDTVIASSADPADAIYPMPAGQLSLIGGNYFPNSPRGSQRPLTGTAPDGAASFNSPISDYLILRDNDVASPYSYAGTSRNWAKVLFAGANSYLAGSAAKHLLAAAGVTPSYRDLGDPGNTTATVTATSSASSTSASSTTATAPTTSTSDPANAGYPSAGTTGVPSGTVLTPYTGPSDLTTQNTPAGTVYNAVSVTSALTIESGVSVTFENSSFVVKGANIVTGRPGAHGTFNNCTVNGGYSLGTQAAFIGSGLTVNRCNIFAVGEGAQMDGSFIVSNSYIHDLYGADGSHNNAVFSNGSQTGPIVISGNTLSAIYTTNDTTSTTGVSGAVSLYGDFAQVNDVTIANNLIYSQNTGIYGGSIQGKKFPHASNVTIVNNEFSSTHGDSGLIDFEAGSAGNVGSNNVWIDGPNAGKSAQH